MNIFFNFCFVFKVPFYGVISVICMIILFVLAVVAYIFRNKIKNIFNKNDKIGSLNSSIDLKSIPLLGAKVVDVS